MIEAQLVELGRTTPAGRADADRRLARLRPQAAPDTPAGCVLLANEAVALIQDAGRATEAVERARRALTGIAALGGGTIETGVLYVAGPVLCAAGALDEAATAADRAVANAQRRGASIELGASLGFRADVAGRRGGLLDAESDGRWAMELAIEAGMPYPRRLILGYLLPSLVERALLDVAEQDLASLRVDPTQLHLLAGVGRLRLAQGRPAEALEQLLACGERLTRRGWRHPGLVPSWRTDAALACHRLGRIDQSRELAAAALATARRFGAPVALGVALRTAGLLSGDVEALQESVETLAETAARVEHVRGLVELGAALRRANHRVEAREPLRAGLDLAHRCSATALATQAAAELAAAGARPRTPVRTGVEALSPSERRVARLAAEGLTNRDIAQALFVTAKTVEVHLSACYRKLDIDSRARLRDVLG